MTLPEGFLFSQGNLQDFQDCQRRFQLHYLLQVAWPAIEAEPAIENENHLQMGAVFHYLIRQHQSGVPVDLLTKSIVHYHDMGKNDLLQWWENYLTAISLQDYFGALFQPKAPIKLETFTEISFSVPLGGFRIIAKYDLLIVESSGSAIIIDWKSNRKRPPRRWLQERMQSRVYPYVLMKASSDFSHENLIVPEQVRMIYWFANFPSDTEQLYYSREQYNQDEAFFLNLVDIINHKSENDFPLTHNEGYCKYCIYRSLCNRGVQAGDFDSAEWSESNADEDQIEITMQQIDEIGF